MASPSVIDDTENELDYDDWEGQFEFMGPNIIKSDKIVFNSDCDYTKSNTILINNTNNKLLSQTSVSDVVPDLLVLDSPRQDIQILEQEVNVLKDTANDDRYTRVRAENAALQARILMLEEQLREDQLRAEERFQDEQRRQRELMVRIEREKQLQIENCSIRLQSVELEAASGREEINRQRALIDRLRQERKEATERAIEAENNYVEAKAQMQSLKENERRLIAERESNHQLLDELSKEIERLRSEARTPALPTTSPETLRLEELHAELESLRLENKQLKETNEELQAALITRSVEEGRSLLVDAQESLAAEFEAMSQDQSKEQELSTIEKMQKALKEQQDVNTQLRAYIEGILLNIVENSPQLLEVKHRSS